MAKKTTSAKKKTLTSATSIAQLIVDKITAVLDKSGYTVDDTVFEEWQPKLEVAVQDRLDAGGKWTTQVEAKVLAVAADMARIVIILADGDPEVPKSRLHAAFRAAKASKKCPGGSGAGAWCDFSI